LPDDVLKIIESGEREEPPPPNRAVAILRRNDIAADLVCSSAVDWSVVFGMTQNNQRRGRLRPPYGYALLIVYLIGCAGGAWAVYRNHGRVPEVPPFPSVTK
jgi:hypothetical protein